MSNVPVDLALEVTPVAPVLARDGAKPRRRFAHERIVHLQALVERSPMPSVAA